MLTYRTTVLPKPIIHATKHLHGGVRISRTNTATLASCIGDPVFKTIAAFRSLFRNRDTAVAVVRMHGK